MSATFTPTRMRISVDRYQKMVAAGVLTRHDRVELIDGEILAMAPIGTRHAEVTDRLTRALVLALAESAIVRVAGPVDLGGFSEPEPDLLVLKNPGPGGYQRAHPKAADVLLLIEVSESSLAFDQGAKRALYARHGVSEYWIVDLNAQRILVYLEPSAGEYGRSIEYMAQDTVRPHSFPGLGVNVSGLLA